MSILLTCDQMSLGKIFLCVFLACAYDYISFPSVKSETRFTSDVISNHCNNSIEHLLLNSASILTYKELYNIKVFQNEYDDNTLWVHKRCIDNTTYTYRKSLFDNIYKLPPNELQVLPASVDFYSCFYGGINSSLTLHRLLTSRVDNVLPKFVDNELNSIFQSQSDYNFTYFAKSFIKYICHCSTNLCATQNHTLFKPPANISNDVHNVVSLIIEKHITGTYIPFKKDVFEKFLTYNFNPISCSSQQKLLTIQYSTAVIIHQKYTPKHLIALLTIYIQAYVNEFFPSMCQSQMFRTKTTKWFNDVLKIVNKNIYIVYIYTKINDTINTLLTNNVTSLIWDTLKESYIELNNTTENIELYNYLKAQEENNTNGYIFLQVSSPIILACMLIILLLCNFTYTQIFVYMLFIYFTHMN